MRGDVLVFPFTVFERRFINKARKVIVTLLTGDEKLCNVEGLHCLAEHKGIKNSLLIS